MAYKGLRSFCDTFTGGVGLAALALSGGVHAQIVTPQTVKPAQNSTALDEIVVTAQKRSENINKVGMSITAQTGAALLARGVSDTADLVKVVPGFSYAPSIYATPVYTLRGVGLYDTGFASSPAVAVYVDEVPLAYPVLQTGALLDLERVEVLKGPQGTLFGQSSTGGAINYIAGKPTDHFEAGADISAQNYGRLDTSGFVSGPITDRLEARLALRSVQGGAWQQSTTRPGDKLGDARQLYGRLLLDWKPTDRLKISLNLNASQDRSDFQAGQLSYNQLNIVPAATPQDPYGIVNPAAYAALTNPKSAGYSASFAGSQALEFGRLNGSEGAVTQAEARTYLSQPLVGNNPTAADWNPSQPQRLDSHVYQVAARVEYKLTNHINLTSITSFARFTGNSYLDDDASAAPALLVREFGHLNALNQELRLSGDTDRLHWVAGLGYDHTSSDEEVIPTSHLASNEPIPGLIFITYHDVVDQTITSKSAFGNVDYNITDALSIQGGIRYTDNVIHASECITDNNADLNFNAILVAIETEFADFGLKNTPVTPIGQGQCFTLTPLPQANPTLEPYKATLSQDNVSWRGGATYKLEQGTLFYANASRGFKSGIFSPIAATTTVQFAPAKQEQLDAYEAGFKAPLLDRRVEFNAAYFHYDYTNKQVRARVSDPLFGLLEKLINVPKSKVDGIEAEFLARPAQGLTLSVAGTYLASKVTGPTSGIYNQEGYIGNFQGSRLPFTPKFSAVGDGEYQWPAGNRLTAFFGGSAVYHGNDNATFATAALPADDMKLPSYVTVDLRAGLEAKNGSWRVTAFGRNIFDKYYVTSVVNDSEGFFRYAGQPATFGLMLRLRTK